MTPIFQSITHLAVSRPLYLLGGGLAITALVAFLFFGCRSYFSAERRKMRKLVRPGIVFRFFRVEVLVALASSAGAIVYEFFTFRGRGHYIYWHGFRHRVGPPHGFFSFARWDSERLLFRAFPAVARWWKILGFHVDSGVLARRGYELQADYFAGYMVVALLAVAGAYYVGWQFIDWWFARQAPALAKNPTEIMIGDVPFPCARWISHFLLLGTSLLVCEVLL